MNKIKLCGVSLCTLLTATGANAAGYTCEELIEYTSCMPGYYFTAGSTEQRCPEDYDLIEGPVCFNGGVGAYEPDPDTGDCGGSSYDLYDHDICVMYNDPETGEEVNDVTAARPLYSTCNDCPAGSACAGGTDAAQKCAAGTYQPETKQISCIDAPAGNFVSKTGATKYTACAAGTYQPDSGQSSCVTCPAGSYCATTGLTSVSGKCAVGTYSTGGASSSNCTECPITMLTDMNGNSVKATTAGTGSTSSSACFIDSTVQFKDKTGIYHYKQECEFGGMSYDIACSMYKESHKNNHCDCYEEDGEEWCYGSECYELINCETHECGDDGNTIVFDPDSGNIACWWPGAYGCSVDLGSLQSGCEDTGGTWNSNDVGCRCPAGYDLTCSSDFYQDSYDPYNSRYVCIDEDGLSPNE